jgi:hypothetical protein
LLLLLLLSTLDVALMMTADGYHITEPIRRKHCGFNQFADKYNTAKEHKDRKKNNRGDEREMEKRPVCADVVVPKEKFAGTENKRHRCCFLVYCCN